MKGFVQDIEGLAVENADFRRVLNTAKNCQLVLLALKPGEEIGSEVHTLDQFCGWTRWAWAAGIIEELDAVGDGPSSRTEFAAVLVTGQPA